MSDALNVPGNYRIEVSGWGLDSVFFVEKTELLWSQSGEKNLLLHHALPVGTVIFIRLLTMESTSNSVPVTYQVESVRTMNCNGQCEMQVRQLHPRSRIPFGLETASYLHGDSPSTREESAKEQETEEILHEA